MATYRVHDEGVWALQVDEAFTTVFSGGRDRRVWATDLRSQDNSELICQEKNPVLKLELVEGPQQPSIWVSTTDSTIRNWPVKVPNNRSSGDYDSDRWRTSPAFTQPYVTIKGGPGIRQYHILNDKRHILTKDSDSNVVLWDVLTARKVEHYGKADFEEVVKQHFKMVFVPPWFSVDLKTGLLTIHLDESDCFAAWMSTKDLGLPNMLLPDTPETKSRSMSQGFILP